MALIKCEECGHEISDKAEICPNCGYRIPKNDNQAEERKETKNDDGWVKAPTPIQPIAQKQKKKVSKKVIIGIVIFFIFCAMVDSLSGSDEEQETNNPVADVQETVFSSKPEEKVAEEPKGHPTEKPKEEKSKDKFLVKLEEKLGEKVAKKTYNVLKKKIGFTDLEYNKKLSGSDNYKITANGYEIVITASDKLYRIFTPHGYVWYEDGKVKNTLKKIKKNEIDSNDRIYYYTISQEIVKNGLKSPSTAKFPSNSDSSMKKKGKLITVNGYVDAQNSFGAKIRSNWTVQFKVIDLDSFSYDVKYLNIDGQVLYGTYKK